MQWRCRETACGRAFSVTSGTKFADRKMPLKTILKGIVVFATNVKGISACSLGRQIGITYQAAFVMLHKLRESILEHADKTPMDGLVHIDGAPVAGVNYVGRRVASGRNVTRRLFVVLGSSRRAWLV